MSKKKTRKPKVLKAPIKSRNPVAMSPLLRKGGVHQKSNKALRAKGKHELRAKVRDSISFTFNALAELIHLAGSVLRHSL